MSEAPAMGGQARGVRSGLLSTDAPHADTRRALCVAGPRRVTGPVCGHRRCKPLRVARFACQFYSERHVTRHGWRRVMRDLRGNAAVESAVPVIVRRPDVGEHSK